MVAHATAKRARKGCDWIVANDVSPETGIMGGTENAVTVITEAGAEVWPRMGKDEVAGKLALRIGEALKKQFASLDLAMPETRTQFRRLVDSLDLTSALSRAYILLPSLMGGSDEDY